MPRTIGPSPTLRRIARCHGLLPSYVGADRRIHHVGDDALVATLEMLGRPLGPSAGWPDLEIATRLDHWRQVLAPVVVTWAGDSPGFDLRLGADAGDSLGYRVEREDGEAFEGRAEAGATRVVRTAEVGGARFSRVRVEIPNALPIGYHRLLVTVAGDTHEATWIVAPRRCMPFVKRHAALFLPLYALRSTASPDCANLTDWRRFATWADALGFDRIGSLPLCAQFLEPPVEPSPYAPVSRLFWNEAYLDLSEVPGAKRPAGPPLVDDPVRVHWDAVAADRLARLDAAADAHFATHGPEGAEDLRRFLAERPDTVSYARFRAAGVRHGRDWRRWPEACAPERLARGTDGADLDPRIVRRHVFAQWLCSRQIGALAADLATREAGLYLDLPVGVHADGYDVWRERDAFLVGASAGAPPDPFFRGGQSWGFPPIDPRGSRDSGHRWFRDCLRHQFRHAALLRIDHIMGLHRIWTIPPDGDATLGCYLRQPDEELFAIVALESRRQRCQIVGEDLGTVPVAIERALPRHRIAGMQVFQFAASPAEPERGAQAPPQSLLALNTHDMPTFASFATAGDVERRAAGGELSATEAATERADRERLIARLAAWLGVPEPDADPQRLRRLLDALLARMAESDAVVLAVGLEDLWLEREPQNVPGTLDPERNWCRRAAVSLDDLVADKNLAARLEQLVRALEASTDGETTEARPQEGGD